MPSSDYVTLAALKSSLSISDTETTFDDDLQLAITAASRAIDELTNRRFYPDADANQSRRFLPINSGYCLIDDLCEFTSLVAQDSTWTLDQDFYLEPINAAADGRPYTAIRTIARPFIFTTAEIASGWSGFDGRITVTGKWGWATTPEQIQQATSILASRLFRRAREAPFAVLGTGIDGGTVSLSRSDPDVAALVQPFSGQLIA